MIKLALRDVDSTIFVSDVVFGCVFNKSLVHQVVDAYFSCSHQGTRAQKNRSAVSGSGKKPWRQKGTGRARSGSIRSPIWRSGGVTFAGKPVDHSKKVNKKMYRGALRSILSELFRQNRLFVVENFSIEKPKTNSLIMMLRDIDLSNNNSVLICLYKLDKNVVLASRNLHKVKVCYLNNLDLCSLVNFDKILMTVKFLRNLEGMLI